MTRWRKTGTSRKGNVTMMWVAGLPIFMVLFLFMASLAVAWMQTGVAQKAADAASLSVTRKMDELVNREIDARMVEALQRGEDPYFAVLGTSGKKRGLVMQVIRRDRDQLVEAARQYLRKNGGGPHGVITFFEDGRIQVEARIPFKPLILEDRLQGLTVKGRGTGPAREYGSWLKEVSKIEF
ncbi:TadE/TadG family type IV pilus assembly protein [Staphylospora marina]|uniref:TadE/TadG family type IV pilus assembly protein n=1 Tax=Staphylospora marina TaxID=2490858 RepID=UPI0013DE33D4|nr:hypothetical protein [Staphylospora marina]